MPRPHFSPINQHLKRWGLGSEFPCIPGDSSVQPGLRLSNPQDQVPDPWGESLAWLLPLSKLLTLPSPPQSLCSSDFYFPGTSKACCPLCWTTLLPTPLTHSLFLTFWKAEPGCHLLLEPPLTLPPGPGWVGSPSLCKPRILRTPQLLYPPHCMIIIFWWLPWKSFLKARVMIKSFLYPSTWQRIDIQIFEWIN